MGQVRHRRVSATVAVDLDGDEPAAAALERLLRELRQVRVTRQGFDGQPGPLAELVVVSAHIGAASRAYVPPGI